MAKQQNGKLPGRFPLFVLVMVLFAVLAATSGMVGFVLGRNADRSTGELLDTIVLSPGDAASQQSRETVHYLSGRLRHNSGDPFFGATVQLVGTDKTDVTDEQGKFYFSGVRAGTHHLEVKNSAGETVTDLELALDFSGTVSAEFGRGYSSFHMTEDARMLEFTITVDDSDAEVDEDSAYFVTKDGKIVDFNGSSLTVQEPAVVILPNVDVVSPAGQVLIPSKGTVVTPQGEEMDIPLGEEVLPGVTVEEDGSVHIDSGAENDTIVGDDGTDENGEIVGNDGTAGNDGIVLAPNGEITLPDGTTDQVGDDVIVAEDGKIEELPELPEEFVPPASAPADPADDPADTPILGEPSVDNDGDIPQDSASAEVPAEPDQPEQGGLSVIDAETSKSWRQMSFIDLFKNRTGGKSVNETVAPGASGYYEFLLQNPEEYDISYTISLKEQSFHLPIRYSLINSVNNYSYLYREKIEAPEALVSRELVIPAGSEQKFRIEWSWDFEDWYNRKLDDSIDTAAATGIDRTYILSVLLNAEQVLTEPEEDPPESGPESNPDDDRRYPGKR